MPDASWNGQESFDSFNNEIIITYNEIISISDAEFEKVVAFRESQLELRMEQEAKRAEQARLDAIKKAEDEKIAAVKLAQEKVEREAREREEKRLAQEAAEKAAKAKLAADIEHRRDINRGALACFVTNGIDEDISKQVISLISQGQIDFITINYWQPLSLWYLDKQLWKRKYNQKIILSWLHGETLLLRFS